LEKNVKIPFNGSEKETTVVIKCSKNGSCRELCKLNGFLEKGRLKIYQIAQLKKKKNRITESKQKKQYNRNKPKAYSLKILTKYT